MHPKPFFYGPDINLHQPEIHCISRPDIHSYFQDRPNHRMHIVSATERQVIQDVILKTDNIEDLRENP